MADPKSDPKPEPKKVVAPAPELEETGADAPDLHARHGHPVLTDDEVDAAHATARANMLAKLRKQAKAALIEQEEARLAREEGLRQEVGGIGDEMVDILIRLPDPRINTCLLINGQAYYHGFRYTVRRHVANSMAEMVYRLEAYTARELKGERLADFYIRPKETVISGRTGAVVAGRLPVGRA